MAERLHPQTPSRTELRLRVRQNIDRLDPALQVVGEDILGLASRIDLVALDATGHIVLILIGDDGQDAQLVTRALAQRAWLQPRLGDWLKLAPDLDIRADSPIRTILLARQFGTETRAAVGSLRDGVVQLATYRYLANAAQRIVLLEMVDGEAHHPSTPVANEGGESSPRHPAFRSGLSDGDLGLTRQERSDLDDRDA